MLIEIKPDIGRQVELLEVESRMVVTSGWGGD